MLMSLNANDVPMAAMNRRISPLQRFSDEEEILSARSIWRNVWQGKFDLW